MSKYAVVLEKASSHADLLAPRGPAALKPSRGSDQRAYAELAAKLFQPANPGRVVAFASVNRGEGVTRTVRGLSAELVLAGKTVVTLDGALHGSPAIDVCLADAPMRIEPAILGAPRATMPETASTFVASLREQYSCILLDCGSLESSTDLLRLASLCDGVVMVVEAGCTGKEQIAHAARVIREADGALLGCVLNKRCYPIPDWLYRLL